MWMYGGREGRTLENLSSRPKRTRLFIVLEIIVLRLLFWWGARYK